MPEEVGLAVLGQAGLQALQVHGEVVPVGAVAVAAAVGAVAVVVVVAVLV